MSAYAGASPNPLPYDTPLPAKYITQCCKATRYQDVTDTHVYLYAFIVVLDCCQMYSTNVRVYYKCTYKCILVQTNSVHYYVPNSLIVFTFQFTIHQFTQLYTNCVRTAERSNKNCARWSKLNCNNQNSKLFSWSC